MDKEIKMLGRTFGKFFVVGKGKDRTLSGHNRKFWIVRCACGLEKEVIGTDLRRGSSRSCGCSFWQKPLAAPPPPVEGATWLPLGFKHGKYTLVDNADATELSQYRWYWTTTNKGKEAVGYAYRKAVVPGGKFTVILLARHLLKPPAGMVVDHVNGDSLDNRRKNLRIATIQQNAQNRGARRNSKTGFKGVYLVHKYQAQIMVDGKTTHLGWFDDPKEAARAYNKAALKLHGEFARLNKVD